MLRITDQYKVDTGLKPQSLASTNATGAYHSLREWAKGVFAVTVAAMAAASTVVLQIMEAQDSSGTGSQALTAGTCTITANTAVEAITITGTTVVATNTITISDGTKTQVYTCVASGAINANGQFNVGASDTLTMDQFVLALAACQPLLVGTNASAVVTIVAKEKGTAKITTSAASGTLVAATLEAVAYIELDPSILDAGFTHVALKATTNATIVVGAILVRGMGRINPIQMVAANYSSPN